MADAEPSQGPPPSSSSSSSSVPPFPSSFESELTAPIPSAPSLAFDPALFFAIDFPSPDAGDVLALQLRRSFLQLTSSYRVADDRSSPHRLVSRAIEQTMDVSLNLMEGLQSLKEVDPSSESVRFGFVRLLRSLRSVHILVSAVDALASAAANDPHDYNNIVKIIEFIGEPMAALKSHSSLALVQSIKSGLSTIKLSLRRTAFVDFYYFLPDLHINTDLTRLNAALRMLDYFPTGARDRQTLLEWWLAIKMAPFHSQLKSNRQWRDILKVADIFAWFYKFLQTYENIGYVKVFPAHWNVDAHIARRFVDACSAHVTALLNALSERFDLYKPLKAAVELELFLASRIKRGPPAPALAGDVFALADQKDNTDDFDRLFTYSGQLSACFEPFLNIFIELEQASLETYVAGLDGTEVWKPVSGSDAPVGLVNKDGEMDPKSVYPTVDLLFTKLSKSLARYSKLIHNETLFAISKEYRRAISDYIKKLEGHLPRLSTAASGAAANRALLGQLEANDLIMIIRLCTSAEECVRRCVPLSAEIAKQLDPQYREYVDFTAVSESANAFAAKAMAVIVAWMVEKIEGSLSVLLKDSKKDIGQSGDSAVVRSVFSLLKREIPRFSHLSAYSSFLTQFVKKFAPAYLSVIKKLTRIEEGWAAILLRDFHVIRSLLLRLHDPEYLKTLYLEKAASADKQTIKDKQSGDKEGEPSGDASASSPSADSFESLLTVELSAIERLLRVLSVPSSDLISEFRVVYPKGTPQMLAELFDLRGLSSGDQKSLVKVHNQGLHVSKQIPLEPFTKGFVSSFMGDLKKQIEKI